MVTSIRKMVYFKFQVLISYRDFPVTVSIFENKEAWDFGPDFLITMFFFYLMDKKIQIRKKKKKKGP